MFDFRFDYNKQTMKLHQNKDPFDPFDRTALHRHVKCLQWLKWNLQEGRDFYWISNTGSRIRDDSDEYAIMEYIFFNKEEDLLAFRLACGI